MAKKTQAESVNFLLAGVGGQGTLLASDILADLGVRSGYDVKKAEVHGMSQRGGSVTSHVRWGAEVFSPIVGKGEVDVLVAFEELEAARYIDLLNPSGKVLVNAQRIEPITVKAGDLKYPDDGEIHSRLSSKALEVNWVNGLERAEKVGNPKTANVVVLGALSTLLELPVEQWLEAIEAHVPPKAVEINRQAFMAGREAIKASA